MAAVDDPEAVFAAAHAWGAWHRPPTHPMARAWAALRAARPAYWAARSAAVAAAVADAHARSARAQGAVASLDDAGPFAFEAAADARAAADAAERARHVRFPRVACKHWLCADTCMRGTACPFAHALVCSGGANERALAPTARPTCDPARCARAAGTCWSCAAGTSTGVAATASGYISRRAPPSRR